MSKHIANRPRRVVPTCRQGKCCIDFCFVTLPSHIYLVVGKVGVVQEKKTEKRNSKKILWLTWLCHLRWTGTLSRLCMELNTDENCLAFTLLIYFYTSVFNDVENKRRKIINESEIWRKFELHEMKLRRKWLPYHVWFHSFINSSKKRKNTSDLI